MEELRPHLGVPRLVGARPGLCIQIPDADPPSAGLPARNGAQAQVAVSRPGGWSGALPPERFAFLQERRMPGLESLSPRLDVQVDLEEVMGWLSAQTPTSTVGGARQPNPSLAVCASTTNTPRSTFVGASAVLDPSPRSAWARGPMNMFLMPGMPSPNLLRTMLKSPGLLPGPEPQILSPLGGTAFCTREIEDLREILNSDNARREGGGNLMWEDEATNGRGLAVDEPTSPIDFNADSALQDDEIKGAYDKMD